MLTSTELIRGAELKMDNPRGVKLNRAAFDKIRALLLMLILGPFGILATLAHLETADYGMASMFGITTIAAFGLGIWLWRRSKRPAN
jgi:hypothetical protein